MPEQNRPGAPQAQTHNQSATEARVDSQAFPDQEPKGKAATSQPTYSKPETDTLIARATAVNAAAAVLIFFATVWDIAVSNGMRRAMIESNNLASRNAASAEKAAQAARDSADANIKQLKEVELARQDSDKSTADQLGVLQQQADNGTVSANASKTAADASAGQLAEMRLASRAWVGPTDAGFKDQPVKGSDAKVVVPYLNTGRQPATDFQLVYFNTFFGLKSNDPSNLELFQAERNTCMAHAATAGGVVIYPNVILGLANGVNGQAATHEVPKANLPDSVFDKQTMVAFTGCMAYHTAGGDHHSAFCFFWDGDNASWQHLSICQGAGNDAD